MYGPVVNLGDFENYDGTLLQEPEPSPTCCGRKVNLCNCMSSKTIFAISTAVGAVLLIVGILALIGYSAPASGGGAVLDGLRDASKIVADYLGSDLLTLAIFPTAFGFIFVSVGLIGLTREAINQRANKIKQYHYS